MQKGQPAGTRYRWAVLECFPRISPRCPLLWQHLEREAGGGAAEGGGVEALDGGAAGGPAGARAPPVEEPRRPCLPNKNAKKTDFFIAKKWDICFFLIFAACFEEERLRING